MARLLSLFLTVPLLALSMLTTAVVAEEGLFKAGTDVLILKEEEFEDKILKKDGIAIVMFYTTDPDKMRHCAEFAPEYEKAATALKGIATVAAVDGPKVSHKMQVQYDNVRGSYPMTIVFGRNKSEPERYMLHRTARAIVAEVQRQVNIMAEARLNAMGDDHMTPADRKVLSRFGSARSNIIRPREGSPCRPQVEKNAYESMAAAAAAAASASAAAGTSPQVGRAQKAAATKGSAPACPHCGNTKPWSCSKCAAAALVTTDAAAAAVPAPNEPQEIKQEAEKPAPEPFIVTEEMVWQDDEL